jgi:dihydrolipoamide dehydrogenase
VSTRFVIVGGGPAGNTAATYAQRYGADVTMIERDVVGGAAHLWDCIPSKTMIATGGAMSFLRRSTGMGLEQAVAEVDTKALSTRIDDIKHHIQDGITTLLDSQGVRMVHGTARFVGPYEIEGHQSRRDPADLVRRRPRVDRLAATHPEWCTPDGDRILTTRDCYPPRTFPRVGDGHRLRRHGRRVRPHVLLVRCPGHARRVPQQVLPGKDPEVAAVLEDDFLHRGVRPAEGLLGRWGFDRGRRDGRRDRAPATTAGRLHSSHAVLAIGCGAEQPTTSGRDARAGIRTDAGAAYRPDSHHNCVTNVRALHSADR